MYRLKELCDFAMYLLYMFMLFNLNYNAEDILITLFSNSCFGKSLNNKPVKI